MRKDFSTERNSNIELLRIFAICTIILSHVMGGVRNYPE